MDPSIVAATAPPPLPRAGRPPISQHDRKCTVCNHPQRNEIEAGMIESADPSGPPLSSLAKKFGLANAAVYYHRKHHLPHDLALAYRDRMRPGAEAAAEELAEHALASKMRRLDVLLADLERTSAVISARGQSAAALRDAGEHVPAGAETGIVHPDGQIDHRVLTARLKIVERAAREMGEGYHSQHAAVGPRVSVVVVGGARATVAPAEGPTVEIDIEPRRIKGE